jgi:hypothetical protein
MTGSMKSPRKRGRVNRKSRKPARSCKRARSCKKKHSRKHRTMRRNKKSNKRRNLQNGGWNLGNVMGSFPFGQDIVNIGRSGVTSASNIGRGFQGVHTAQSQWPTEGQLPKSAIKRNKPFDLAANYKQNKIAVKGIGPS